MVEHTISLPNRTRITTVRKIRSESEAIRTVLIEDEQCSRAAPGQFAMLWVPGVGESPMSLSVMDKQGLCGFTVKSVGSTSNALCSLREGDQVGVRGPYGNRFSLINGSSLLVGGGTGLAPLIPLSQQLIERGCHVTLILAAKTRSELLFLKEAEHLLQPPRHQLVVATDDGSYGFKGFASDCAADLLKRERYNMIYTCGPEKMMRKIFDLAEAKTIPVQASLERYMKCGFGLCGSCAIGPYLVCTDGPIFNS
ncbi:MAG: dihydroorotate dehydrogenase electron transfer subunit, partial [Thaumarchaeota archaeon]|nr:dihydroorotate dehydrogenase electron transfer subunit [Nitrososphaerota archaeon]